MDLLEKWKTNFGKSFFYPKPCDLVVNLIIVISVKCRKIFIRFTVSGEKPIEQGDSWFFMKFTLMINPIQGNQTIYYKVNGLKRNNFNQKLKYLNIKFSI